MSPLSKKVDGEITEYLTKTLHYNVEPKTETVRKNAASEVDKSGDENDRKENSENSIEIGKKEIEETKHGLEVDGNIETCKDVTIILSTIHSRYYIDIENSLSKLSGKQFSILI